MLVLLFLTNNENRCWAHTAIRSGGSCSMEYLGDDVQFLRCRASHEEATPILSYRHHLHNHQATARSSKGRPRTTEEEGTNDDGKKTWTKGGDSMELN
ncbi:uncharacterized protein CELE_Y49E10.30 [Caenorhabditis elegans]|uniref:Secreted protein n=1 Tax=Caenorhabditis elegans TaxID=6239 RepID=D3YTA0_CAEEL|nr:Secreted protein [Caenorhabditis elegans]CBK19505.1 Secreted protein [Caenorhabditis elegans]|eukprot:NP_001255164.1 Uncharacterized protein CELE_Y49E10.30 [Caenorhabditis elegans]